MAPTRHAHPYLVGVSDTRLDEYDQIEWWDVARRLHPAMTWEEFERDWDEFVTSRETSRPPRG